MNRREFLQFSAATLAAASAAEAQTAPSTRFASTNPADIARIQELGGRGVRIHDPSTIVKCKDEYWIFYTGRGVPSYRSKDLIKWTPGPRAIDVAPAWTADAVPANRGTYYWAPEIYKSSDRYLLYYAVSTFGKKVSAIGLASNPTLDPADPAFHWTDRGLVVQSTDDDKFNAIDPAVFKDVEGNTWLSFGSYWSGIKLIQLDPATGKRIAADSAMYSLAYNRSIEASYLFQHGEFIYLIVNWGQCCRGVNSTYNMRIGRSKKVTGPYLDKDNKDLAQNGGSLFLATDGPFIGPGQAGIFQDGDKTWISMHYYDATRFGMSALAIRPITWDTDGWPVVGNLPV